MLKGTLRTFGLAIIAIGVAVGIAYAVPYSGEWFKAEGSDSDDSLNTQVMQHRIHMTNGQDTLAFADERDLIHMGPGNDEIAMANGSDILSFFGQSTTTETIEFNDGWDSGANPPQRIPATSYIKWTGATDQIEVRSNSGDVVITLGQ